MSGRQIRFKKIPIWSVVEGIILLCGVLLVAYGFHLNSEAALYCGLALTILGALVGIIFFVVSLAKMRVQRDGGSEGGKE